MERLPDGTSHLLLRIDDDAELIDAKNPNKARGRYKYRFKRIPLPENWTSNEDIKEKLKHQQQKQPRNPTSQQEPSQKMELSDQFSDDSEPELIAIAEKSKDIVRNAVSTAVRRLDTGLDDIKEESENATSSCNSHKSSKSKNRKESSKSKHFKLDADQAENRSFDSNETIGDVVRSLSYSENDDTTNKNSESDSEINVANENFVTKVTKEKQKKINQEKTVIIEENYVITSRDEHNLDENQGDQENLIEKEEKSKTYIDDEVRITTKESGKDKPRKKEKLISKKHTEPSVVSTIKELGDEKLVEKFKPEETIQYEYEQVIEQPESGQSNDSNNITIENTQKKTTKYESKEKFQKIENPSPDKVKKITTDLTTLITEEEEDKITETIEKSKDVQEFSYQQLNARQPTDSTSRLKMNLTQLAERLQPMDVDSDPLHTITASKNQSKAYEFSHRPNNPDECEIYTQVTYEKGKHLNLTPNSSSLSDNILDYYKLKPVDNEIYEDEEDNRLKLTDIIQPVDLNMLQTGEQFKPDETVSYNEIATFSKGLTTKQSDQPIREDDEDSLAEIEENFIITFKSPSVPLQESKLDSPKEKSYYKPIETLTADDFYRNEKSTKPIHFIKAKFENKDSDSKRSSSRSDDSLGTVGKLPKSKVEIYDKDSLSSSSHSRSSKSSDSDDKLSKKITQSKLTEEKRPQRRLDFERKSSEEEDSVYRQAEKAQEASNDKGIKSLLNKYERKPSVDSLEAGLSRTQSPATSDQPRPVRKLPQNIVQLFDRKESTDSAGSSTSPRSRSSYRSAKSETDQVPYVRSAKSSHSSTRNEMHKIPRADSYQNDDVFEEIAKEEAKSAEGQERVRKLSKLLIDQYEKKDQSSDSRSSSERKSRSDTKSDPNESLISSSYEERKRLPKSTLELYEPKDKFSSLEKKSSSSDSRKSLDKPKQSTIIMVNQSDASKERIIYPSDQVDTHYNTNDSGVKDKIFKYEKRPSQTSSEDGSDDLKQKSPTIKKILSSFTDESKPPLGNKNKEDEKNIKKLINKYEVPKDNLEETTETFTIDVKYQKAPLEEVRKKSREHSVDSIFDKTAPLMSNLPKDNEYHSEKEPNYSSQSNEKGVKRLVDIYEKKPSESSESSSGSINSPETPKTSKTKHDTSSKLGKYIEKYERSLSQTSDHTPSKQSGDSSRRESQEFSESNSVRKQAKVKPEEKILKDKEVNLSPIKDLSIQQSQVFDKQLKHKENISTSSSSQPISFSQRPDLKIFHNDYSNLTAVLHIPDSANPTGIKKSPRIRVVLKGLFFFYL